MNNKRRKEIDKAIGLLEEAKSILEQCASEEREVYDNMPENLQSGDRGQTTERCADALDEAVSNLDDVINNASDMKGE